MAVKKKRKRSKRQTTRTKEGSASRFGPRYGAKHKKKINELEKNRRRQKCPKCGKKSLKKTNFAVWECTKCGAKMAGGAYSPVTALGQFVEKILSKKLTAEEKKVEEKEILEAKG